MYHSVWSKRVWRALQSSSPLRKSSGCFASCGSEVLSCSRRDTVWWWSGRSGRTIAGRGFSFDARHETEEWDGMPIRTNFESLVWNSLVESCVCSNPDVRHWLNDLLESGCPICGSSNLSNKPRILSLQNGQPEDMLWELLYFQSLHYTSRILSAQRTDESSFSLHSCLRLATILPSYSWVVSDVDLLTQRRPEIRKLTERRCNVLIQDAKSSISRPDSKRREGHLCF